MSSIPKWDRKAATCARSLVQVNALDKYYDYGNAMDKVEMRDCPTKAEYSAIDQEMDLADVDAEKQRRS